MEGIDAANSFGDENRYRCYIYLQASRFNHGCVANANHFLHPNDEIEVRAVKTIMEGEEIVISYIGDTCLNLAQRMELLFQSYGFICGCPACDFGSPSQKKNYKISEEFKKLFKNIEIIEGDLKVEGYKRLYMLAKASETVSFSALLDLLEKACFAAKEAKQWRDLVTFTKAGVIIAKRISGENMLITGQWICHKAYAREMLEAETKGRGHFLGHLKLGQILNIIVPLILFSSYTS